MSYVVFITRDDCYPFLPSNKVENPIDSVEWQTLVANDHTLRFSEDEIEVAHCQDFSQTPLIFDSDRGDIRHRDPTLSVIAKMVELAGHLNAHVRGADGEFYRSGKDFYWPDHPDFGRQD